MKVKDDRFVFTKEALELSAYMRELLLMFYWTAFEAKAEFNVQNESDFRDIIVGLDKLHAEILLAAATRYQEDVFEPMTEAEDNSQLRKFYSFTPYKGDWWEKKSRAQKHNSTWKQSQNPKDSPVVPYFTLPDPWEIKLDKEKIPQPDDKNGPQPALEWGPFKSALRKKVTDKELDSYPHNKTAYGGGDFFEGTSVKEKEVTGYEALFEKYFRRVMTDPAWVLPYNHSLRFGIDRFKENFFKSDSGTADAGKREDFMKKDVIPEFRDAIGYHDSNLK